MTFKRTSEGDRRTDPSTKASNRKLIVRNFAVVLLVLLIGVGAWWVIRGMVAKTVNVETAEEVTMAYVEALHNEEVGSAYKMLAEEVRSRQSQEDYASYLKADPNNGAIEEYEGLEVCEYQFGDIGSVTAIGLLHYEGGDIYFVSTLVEGSDKAWRIYKFHTDSVVKPKPWAGCLSEGD